MQAGVKAKFINAELRHDNSSTLNSGFHSQNDKTFQAMANGENIGKALEESFKQIIAQLTAMILKALIFKAVMTALGLPTVGGGGGLTSLASDFGSTQNGGQFVLRGQDLVLAMQRSNSSLNIIRG